MNIRNLDELIGKRIVVTADAGTLGYMVVERHLNARRLGATGVVKGYVPGHGGDVVYVQHDDRPDDPVATYCHLNELEFYTDAALVFALEKAHKLRLLDIERNRLTAPLDQQITELKLRPFEALTEVR